MTLFAEAYRGRRVLVTGHTGFKGSWLALWLHELGARIAGVSLDPQQQPNHWDLLRLGGDDHRLDIRDAARLTAAVEKFRPEVVFHLAAQPLVRRSYAKPVETWSTNVMGTCHLLEACRSLRELQAVVVVTTDKVYANREWAWGYREDDALGGHDPYSSSKAACELLVASYRKAFFQEGEALLASARAGNVIGGGDWSEDRLVPDLVRALARRETAAIRSPQSVRPWQHVLDSLAGYLQLGQKLLEGRRECAQAWNFGPLTEDHRTVAELLAVMRTHWPQLKWRHAQGPQPRESTLLYLDHAKARTELGWRPVWSVAQAAQATARWYQEFYRSGAATSREQLAQYIDAAAGSGTAWAKA